MKTRAIAFIVCLLLPLSANAVVEKMYVNSMFLDYPIGSPTSPTVVGFESNSLSFTADGMNVVVSTLYDLTTAPPFSVSASKTFRVMFDGNVNIIGAEAEESFVSSDGSTVAFKESSGGPLLRRDLNNMNEQQILANVVSYFTMDNTASRVAYVRNDDVYTVDIDGNNELMLHDTSANADIEIVDIAGNGSKVIFAANPDGLALTPDPPTLFVIDIDGSNLLQLTDSAAEGAGNSATIRGASITDDGSVIVYAKSWAPGIFMVNSDGTNEVQLVSLAAQFPVISGDGSTVAFLSDAPSQLLPGSGSNFVSVYSFPVASPGAITAHVPFGLSTQREWNVDFVAISPTGQYVFFTSPEDYFNGGNTRDFRDVYVYRSTGFTAGGGGSTGAVIPGGISTTANSDTTALDRFVIAMLILAVAAAGMRRTRPGQLVTDRRVGLRRPWARHIRGASKEAK